MLVEVSRRSVARRLTALVPSVLFLGLGVWLLASESRISFALVVGAVGVVSWIYLQLMLLRARRVNGPLARASSLSVAESE